MMVFFMMMMFIFTMTMKLIKSLNINGVEYKENDIMLFKTSPKYKQYNTSNIDSFTLKKLI